MKDEAGGLTLSSKNLAIGTIVLLFSLIAFLSFFSSTYEKMQSLNPIAVIGALTVAVIGIIWFKKTAKT
jgi:hypothetical protein